MHIFRQPRVYFRAVAFHPDGRCLISAELGGVLRFWDRSTGHQTAPFTLSGEYHIAALSVSPDGRVPVTHNGLYRLPRCGSTPNLPPSPVRPLRRS
jgi:hypothetical protein